MKCIKCEREKQDTEFGSRKGKKRRRCLECDAEYHKAWYLKHREKRSKEQRKRNFRERADFKRKIEEVKSRPCADCNVKYDPVCMDFDHLRDKKHNISDMKHRSWEDVLKEISKCEIVCANCHRLRTKTRRSSPTSYSGSTPSS